MKLRLHFQLLCVMLIVLSFCNYFLLRDANSFWDEVLFCSITACIAVLYWIVLANALAPISGLTIVLQRARNHFQTAGTSDTTNPVAEASFVVNSLVENVRAATAIVSRLKAGNLEDAGNTGTSNNALIHALEELRVELKRIQKVESERQWASDGMSKFVDILKADYASEKAFYDQLISSIVRYMGASQGGLFLVSNNDQENDLHLEMVSCYAYERHKILAKRVEVGQGIIGQSYLEKSTVLLRQVPDKYVAITSGLGQATPSNLLIVPFVLNDRVECLIEIASFSEFEKYQIDFLEKLGESIASKISNLRVSARTNRLLKETQLFTEQLRAQEEEMRQNMEELTATQEEMGRKEKELSRLLEQSTKDQAELNIRISEIEKLKEENQRESARMLDLQEKYQHDIVEILNQIPAKIFLKDSKGSMILCNKTVADGYNLSVKQLIGTHDRDHFDPEQVKIWEAQEQEIMRGGKKTFVQEERLHNNIRYLKTTKMPFFIHHLNQTGIMGFQFDVTDTLGAEKLEKELREEIAQLRSREASVVR